jgi:hypothetical protein
VVAMAEPIDLQNILSKTQAAEKLVKLEKAKPDLAQSQFNADFQTKVKNRKSKVQDTEKTDEVIIHKDNNKKEKDKKEKDKEDGEKKAARDEGHTGDSRTGDEIDNGENNDDDDHVEFWA